jgi:hypothetical protein
MLAFGVHASRGNHPLFVCPRIVRPHFVTVECFVRDDESLAKTVNNSAAPVRSRPTAVIRKRKRHSSSSTETFNCFRILHALGWQIRHRVPKRLSSTIVGIHVPRCSIWRSLTAIRAKEYR